MACRDRSAARCRRGRRTLWSSDGYPGLRTKGNGNPPASDTAAASGTPAVSAPTTTSTPRSRANRAPLAPRARSSRGSAYALSTESRWIGVRPSSQRLAPARTSPGAVASRLASNGQELWSPWPGARTRPRRRFSRSTAAAAASEVTQPVRVRSHRPAWLYGPGLTSRGPRHGSRRGPSRGPSGDGPCRPSGRSCSGPWPTAPAPCPDERRARPLLDQWSPARPLGSTALARTPPPRIARREVGAERIGRGTTACQHCRSSRSATAPSNRPGCL